MKDSLREHELTRMLPVVVLTSSLEEQDIIRSYGLEAFKKLWCRFNIEVNLARYKEGRSKAIDFPAAFDTMFQAFAKVSFSQFEAAWRTKVLSLAGVEDD